MGLRKDFAYLHSPIFCIREILSVCKLDIDDIVVNYEIEIIVIEPDGDLKFFREHLQSHCIQRKHCAPTAVR